MLDIRGAKCRTIANISVTSRSSIWNIQEKEEERNKDDRSLLRNTTKDGRAEGISSQPKLEDTFVTLLRACAKDRDLQRGRLIHADVAQSGLLERNGHVVNALINMYAKCGALDKAQEVFDKLSVRTAVAWNVLITGYVQYGHVKKALDCFELMQCQGLSPDPVALVCILKACGSTGAVDKGQTIHAGFVNESLLEKNIIVGTTLVDMYAKCGLLAKALELFNFLPHQDIIAWNALLAGYAHHGHNQEALHCFEQLQHQGFSPNSGTYISGLKACGSLGALYLGQEIHSEVTIRSIMLQSILVSTALIDMYAKCGMLTEAQHVFDQLMVRDAVSWNALIAGYAEHAFYEEALDCFERMKQQGLSPDVVTFICTLKACGSIGTDKTEAIHAEIVKVGLLKKDITVGIALVDAYARSGAFLKAQKVLEELPIQSVAGWNALIRGYADQGDSESAFECFETMQYEGLLPDSSSFVSILKACGNAGAIGKGKLIHRTVIRKGLMGKDTWIGIALVDMYAKCGAFAIAQLLFNSLPIRSIACWNVLIGGFIHHGHAEEALTCFEQMQDIGLSPDAVTYLHVIKACASLGAVEKGQTIRDAVFREGLVPGDILVTTSLVDFYVKCGELAKAQELFEKLLERNVVSWNVLIAGYAQHGHGEEALACFDQMHQESLFPDKGTYISVLKACSDIGSAFRGEGIHAAIATLLENDTTLGTALVDMYVKCAAPKKAQEVFGQLSLQNIISWNALIAGYAQLGMDAIVVDLFDKVIGGCMMPDAVTFSVVLNACSHSGLVSKGLMFFSAMRVHRFMAPTLDHYTCMVDLFGRAGQLNNVVAVINEIPFHVDLAVWHIVLSTCQKWENVRLGKLAFDHLIQLEHKDDASYICMANLYVIAGSYKMQN